jgi:hypothetical protein
MLPDTDCLTEHYVKEAVAERVRYFRESAKESTVESYRDSCDRQADALEHWLTDANR